MKEAHTAITFTISTVKGDHLYGPDAIAFNKAYAETTNNWVHYTDREGNQVDVNLDHVAEIIIYKI